MVRFNTDGTQAYQTVDVPVDYALIIVPVKWMTLEDDLYRGD